MIESESETEQAISVQPKRGRWVYIAASEEPPVTLQIGVVAVDGVILASDKRALHRAGTVDSSSLMDKIRCRQNPPIGYCWAGNDDLMVALTRRFVQSLQSKDYHSDDIRQSLEDAGWEVWEQLYGPREGVGRPIQFTHGISSILLAYPCMDGTKLFRLGFDRYPTAKVIHDKTVEGDCANSAAFFVERYYDSYQFQERKIQYLLPLVAHCILMGAHINKNVEGLELAVCTSEKCIIMEDLSELRQISGHLDSEIAKLLKH